MVHREQAALRAGRQGAFLDFISDAGPRLHKISRNLVADPRPVGGSLFRIYRDVRFSNENT